MERRVVEEALQEDRDRSLDYAASRESNCLAGQQLFKNVYWR